MSLCNSSESRYRKIAPLFTIPMNACKAFIDSLKSKKITTESLDIFKRKDITDEVISFAPILVSEIHDKINNYLNDAYNGIAAIDIPHGISSNLTHDTLLGAIISQTITSSFMKPALDRKNATPFTIYNASKAGEEKLKKAGLKFYSPAEKIGFHTDGRIEGSKVYIPEFLSIYNLFIAYKKTGDFHWLPFLLWNEFEEFAEVTGWNTPFEFELTPIVYSFSDRETPEALPVKKVKAPIFWKRDDKKCMFLNGEINTDQQNLITSLKSSMLNNNERLYVPQKPRRLMMMKNSAGAHSRDIFNQPIEGTRYTRSFMRSTSIEGVHVGTAC
jgi:hypothetical protein